jgi:hypothetical protein
VPLTLVTENADAPRRCVPGAGIPPPTGGRRR